MRAASAIMLSMAPAYCVAMESAMVSDVVGMAGLLLCFDACRLTRANVGKKTSCAKKENCKEKMIYMIGRHKWRTAVQRAAG